MSKASGVPSSGLRSGPIEGFMLTRRVWAALENDNIRTLAQLTAIASRIEQIVPGIGRKAAGRIREQLERIDLLPMASPDAGCPASISRARSAGRTDVPASEAIQVTIKGGLPLGMEPVYPMMVICRTICPRCGNSEVRVVESFGPSCAP